MATRRNPGGYFFIFYLDILLISNIFVLEEVGECEAEWEIEA